VVFSLSSLGREERARERRAVFMGLPLSSVLSPLVPRGERRKSRGSHTA
jgi:hypothetical protein